VEMDTWVLVHPCSNGWMLVRGVVVEDDVDLEVGRNGSFHLAKESFVVMRNGSGSPFLQGQSRLCAIEGLDLALLVP